MLFLKRAVVFDWLASQKPKGCGWNVDKWLRHGGGQPFNLLWPCCTVSLCCCYTQLNWTPILIYAVCKHAYHPFFDVLLMREGANCLYFFVWYFNVCFLYYFKVYYIWKWNKRNVCVWNTVVIWGDLRFPMAVSMQLESVGTRLTASSSNMTSRLESSIENPQTWN